MQSIFQNTFQMDEKPIKKYFRKNFPRSTVKLSQRIEIIRFFLTNQNNSVKTIMEELNVTASAVHHTLDNYFKFLTQQQYEKNYS